MEFLPKSFTDDLHKPTMRVLKVFEALAASEKGLTLTELSDLIGCPKSTLMPILKTLTETGYCTCEPDTLSYAIGYHAFVIGNTYSFDGSILELITEHMEQITAQSNETCHLGVLSGTEILYLKKILPPKPVQLLSSVGKRLPAYATALGKALLSDKSLAELEELFPDQLEKITPYTITDVRELYDNIHTSLKETGFVFEDKEITPYTQCYAVPLHQNGRLVAALSVSYLIFDMTDERREEIRHILKHYAVIIEKLIASQGLFY